MMARLYKVYPKKLQAEVGEIKRSPSFCLFNFTFPKEKVVGSYENNYVGYYCYSGILKFRVMADSLWKCNVGGEKYELRHIHND